MTYKIAKTQAVYYYLAILIIIALGIIFYYNSKKVITSGNHVTHTYAVMDKNQELLLDVMNFETASRGYLLTGNPSFITSYRQSLAQVEQNIVILLNLTKDNPNQYKRVEELQLLITNRIKISEKLIEANNFLSVLPFVW